MDRIIFFNLPERKKPGFLRAVKAGLTRLRWATHRKDEFEVLIYFEPHLEREEIFLTEGASVGPRALAINYNPKKFAGFPERNRLAALAGTVIHEAVHCLRQDQKMKTILHALLNEGVSCFVQTELAGPPDYLDFGGTTEDDIRKWWDWWRKPYFAGKIDHPFWDDTAQRIAAYRVGYFIVSNYWDAHPDMTFVQLIQTDFRTLERFAQKLFAKRGNYPIVRRKSNMK